MDIWESVIEQIKTDLEACDETAIYEMLCLMKQKFQMVWYG